MELNEIDCMYEWFQEEEFRKRCPKLSQVYWNKTIEVPDIKEVMMEKGE